MPRNSEIDHLYEQHRQQIDALLHHSNYNYAKTAKIASWFYGGSADRWRHVLSEKKKDSKIPSEVKELFDKLKN